jgi:hypothetical protein
VSLPGRGVPAAERRAHDPEQDHRSEREPERGNANRVEFVEQVVRERGGELDRQARADDHHRARDCPVSHGVTRANSTADLSRIKPALIKRRLD